MKRKIFPALLDKDERGLLAGLSKKSGRSQSAVIRDLIFKEAACPRQDHSLPRQCRDLIRKLLRDKTIKHHDLLLKEVKRFFGGRFR